MLLYSPRNVQETTEILTTFATPDSAQVGPKTFPCTEASRIREFYMSRLVRSAIVTTGIVSAFVSPTAVQAYSLPQCSDEVTVLKGPNNREVVLIGTAHISEDSVTLVRDVIRALQPDTVMIELDPKRLGRTGAVGDRTLSELGFDIPDQSTLLRENVSAATTMPAKKMKGIYAAFDGLKRTINSWAEEAAGASKEQTN